VPDATLYLFDGFNLLHATDHGDVRELTDMLAGFVAMEGARGVVVFDGVGPETTIGALEVRYAPHADSLLERLAAEHRATDRVCLVSSDATLRGTAGIQVKKLSSATFLGDIEEPRVTGQQPSRLEDRLDADVRAKLERMRRGQQS
jgi:predicted RNA-binding protein with PIN domain